MLLPFVLLAAADVVAIARERLAAEQRCSHADTTDVTVCGLRQTDRFRVPLATRDRRDDVSASKAAMLRRPSPIDQLSPFLVGGGMVGVTARTSFGASGGGTYVRPLAP